MYEIRSSFSEDVDKDKRGSNAYTRRLQNSETLKKEAQIFGVTNTLL